MRAAAILLVFAAAAGAGENLLPREGSGWTGFAAGSRIKTKQTFITARGSPSVTITETRLKSVGKSTLTLSIETKTALGVDNQTTEQTIPTRGEAGTDEKAVEGEPAKAEVQAGGKTYACTRRTFTITGPTGKRVVTNWEAAEPKVRVKRTEIHYDPTGKRIQTFSMLLKSLGETRKVSGKEVRCVEYSTLRIAGPVEQKGTATLSRDLPGGVVRWDVEVFQDGVRKTSVRVEVLAFKAKPGES
jgi:hypothetical protein